MRNACLYALFASAFCVVLSSGASAATVNPFREKVSINRGNGYAPVGGGTIASPGDMVMASPSGSAEIVYEDGCRQKVDPGTVVTVSATSPCKSAALDPTWVLGGLAVAGGVTAAVLLTSDDDHKPSSP